MAEAKVEVSEENLLEIPENAEYKMAIEEFLLHHRDEIEKCLREWRCEKCANFTPAKIEASLPGEDEWDEAPKKFKKPPKPKEAKKSSVRCERGENCWIHLSAVVIGRKGKNKHIGTVCKRPPRGNHPALEKVRDCMENFRRGFVPVVIVYRDNTADVALAKLPW